MMGLKIYEIWSWSVPETQDTVTPRTRGPLLFEQPIR